MMKKLQPRLFVALSVSLMSLTCAVSAFADQSSPAKSTEVDKDYTGTITGIDQTERVLTVKGLLFTRTFNLSEDCTVALQNQEDASLSDLKKGQKVEVQYQDVRGVRVANRIAQQDLDFQGHIKTIDPATGTLSVKHGGFAREFVIAKNCEVVLYRDKSGSLDDLAPGHTVTVVYEVREGPDLVRRIEQRSETFAGTIRAIDVSERTVKVRGSLSEKKFNLADHCQIVLPGESNARLNDLHIGDHVVFSYENQSGVLIATRIGRETGTPDSEDVQTAKAK